MATKSFLKENVIETEQDAILFVEALEKAEKISKVVKKPKVKFKNIKDKNEIKKILAKMEK